MLLNYINLLFGMNPIRQLMCTLCRYYAALLFYLVIDRNGALLGNVFDRRLTEGNPAKYH